MAFFGLFGKPSPETVIKRHSARVADKRAQSPDRWDSIQAIGSLKTTEAVQALMVRFTYHADPSITDQDEKDEAFRLIVETGEPALPAVRAFMKRSDSLAWPLKILDRLLSAEQVVGELLTLLSTMSTDYERDPARKVHVLQALEERRDPRILEASQRFLEDMNETVRFHAASAILAQDNVDQAREALGKALEAEDSVRVRARLLETFAERGWDVGAARAKIEKAMPAGFSLDSKGIPKRR